MIATFRAVPDEAWDAPRAPGKWSPAQIAEHLRLTYALAAEEARGGQGMRLRAAWWLRPLLRLRYLGRIMRTSEFPAGAPAVREIRPGAGPFPREALLAGLAAEGERFLAAARVAGAGAGLTHPFFGKFPLADGVLLSMHHLRHHERQLLAVAAAPAGVTSP